MKVRNKDLLTVFVAVAGCTALFLALTCYRHGPWRGKVIDAETGEPIEGAAVVAVWQTSYIGPAGTTENFLDASETLTDKNGDFVIPRRYFMQILFVRGIDGPSFTIFKPGYGVFQAWPKYPPDNLFEERSSVVKLPRLRTREERVRNLPGKPIATIGHEEKIRQYIHLLSIENRALGLEPYKEETEQ